MSYRSMFRSAFRPASQRDSADEESVYRNGRAAAMPPHEESADISERYRTTTWPVNGPAIRELP